MTHDGKCITVFSAPNYCDTMGNKGAFITLDGADMTPKYTTYEGKVKLIHSMSQKTLIVVVLTVTNKCKFFWDIKNYSNK